MITLEDIITHVKITTESGKIVLLPKNQYNIYQDENDANHIVIKRADRIEFDFHWEQVASPASANPEVLIETLHNMFYTAIISYEDAVSQGLYNNTSLVLKSGRNPNITSASVPEDIINGSTPYPGFPLSSPEELQFLSDNAGDTGVVTFQYLATNTSTEYQIGTITLNGTTPVNSGITAYRVHTMFYNNGSTATFNLGTITCRWRTTTTVIFLTIPVGCSQSYSAIFTIPFGSFGIVKRLFCEVHDASSVSVQGALWTRLQGASPRLRRNFACQTGSAYIDQIYGGVVLPQMTDIALRITQCTSNSATVIVGGFDLVISRAL